jgi:hypothetical protein
MHQHHQQHLQHLQLDEGLAIGDLKHLVDDRIHIDEFNSKMGQPADVVTLSFKIRDVMPAQDLVSFLENGYDWVLDADVSTGEVSDNNRLVFVEAERTPKLYSLIKEMLGDLDHLTGIKPDSWRFKWFKHKDYLSLNEENFNSSVPTSPEKYVENVDHFQAVQKTTKSMVDDVERIKKLSGIK